jgi:two-component system CheB/CheR fusion protein
MTSAHAPDPTSPHRVLIVDDYPDSADISAMLLSLFGYDCQVAVTGQDALAQAAAFDPDIVILDIGLPDISGYEVAQRLRAQARARPLFLAAVTGWGQPEDRVRAMAAGFDVHVLKPTDSAKIQHILALAARARAGALDGPAFDAPPVAT